MIGKLMDCDGKLTVFDENLWAGIVEYVVVYSKDRIVFTFVGSIKITA